MKIVTTQKKSRGFSLLELLVVISIIGILMAIMGVAYTTAQKKSRDARRRGDIKSMQDGFEQWYSMNDYVYDTTATSCAGMTDTTIFPDGFPSDPKGGTYQPYTCGTLGTDGYCVCAQLENSDGNSAAGCGSAGDTHYCLTNLQ